LIKREKQGNLCRKKNRGQKIREGGEGKSIKKSSQTMSKGPTGTG